MSAPPAADMKTGKVDEPLMFPAIKASSERGIEEGLDDAHLTLHDDHHFRTLLANDDQILQLWNEGLQEEQINGSNEEVKDRQPIVLVDTSLLHGLEFDQTETSLDGLKITRVVRGTDADGKGFHDGDHIIFGKQDEGIGGRVVDFRDCNHAEAVSLVKECVEVTRFNKDIRMGVLQATQLLKKKSGLSTYAFKRVWDRIRTERIRTNVLVDKATAAPEKGGESKASTVTESASTHSSAQNDPKGVMDRSISYDEFKRACCLASERTRLQEQIPAMPPWYFLAIPVLQQIPNIIQ